MGNVNFNLFFSSVIGVVLEAELRIVEIWINLCLFRGFVFGY